MLKFSSLNINVGDMNTTPASDLWSPLLEAGWQDAWAVIRGDEPGFTFESDRLFMRIDDAWASHELAGYVAQAGVVQREREGVRMSDHLGLSVSLNLEL